jgi:hypothetical protein
METIKNYLDNMFANLPKTNKMIKLKNDLISNMEEKYNENKNDGKSENEAIGIVISEFGNIEELINELGIDCKKEETILRTITQEEAESFMAAKKKCGLLVGIGVFLCIMAVAMKRLTTTLLNDGTIGKSLSNSGSNMLGPIVLVILILPAVVMFIYSRMELEKYEYLQNGFDLPLHVKAIVESRNDTFGSTHRLSVIIGVCLCLIAPIVLFGIVAFNENNFIYGLVILLMMIASSVFLFIYFGSIKESFTVLLKGGEFTKDKTVDNKHIGLVASIVWPLAVCIFLISGFGFNLWSRSWIVFPITAILFRMFIAVKAISN